MRESCSCGAFIQTTRYRRVKDWRGSHRHDVDAEEVIEPDKQGAIAHVERSYQDDDTTVYARMGFNPNPERPQA